MTRYFSFWLLLALVVCTSGCFGPAEYATRAELEQSEKQAGYVPLGHFGDHWPAHVVEERSEIGAIDFTLNSGARHSYPGYDGYRLKLVRLEDDSGHETVLIFRSAERI